MRPRLAPCAAALVGLLAADGASAAPAQRESGLVERVEVELLLLDVHALDEQGRPMYGLKRQEFDVRLGGQPWPVKTLDDLCPPAAEPAAPAGLSAAEAGPTGEGAPSAASARPAEPGPGSFVLYFDFAELDMGRRGAAAEIARQWVGRRMRPQDRALVVAYSGGTGLEIVEPFTSDRAAVLQAIDRAYADPRLNDLFASSYGERLRECRECCADRSCACDMCWGKQARAEYVHQFGALAGMRGFLEQLQEEPGRKVLLLFSFGELFPSRKYPTSREYDVLGPSERVAAEATLAHTSIQSAWNTELGVNLGEMTGVPRGQPFGGDGGECVYRLGLRVPPRVDHVFRVRVEARGQVLGRAVRVWRPGPTERWLRAARRVLRDPARAVDVPLAAALVPGSAGRRGWSLRVELAFDPRSVVLPRATQGTAGEWEVGALLADANGRHTRELLAVSALRSATTAPDRPIVHRHVLESLPPGHYELRAFIRDRARNAYGGAQASIDLPRPSAPGFAGPLLLGASTDHLDAELPLLSKPRTKATAGVTVHGPVPLPAAPVTKGQVVEFATWICPAPGEETPLQSWMEFEGTPIFRFERSARSPAGACALVRDELDTTPMEPGSYRYQVRWAARPPAAEGTARLGLELVDRVP